MPRPKDSQISRSKWSVPDRGRRRASQEREAPSPKEGFFFLFFFLRPGIPLGKTFSNPGLALDLMSCSLTANVSGGKEYSLFQTRPTLIPGPGCQRPPCSTRVTKGQARRERRAWKQAGGKSGEQAGGKSGELAGVKTETTVGRVQM